jgi:hypothetical protein
MGYYKNPFTSIKRGTIRTIVLVVLLIVLIILIRRGFNGLREIFVSIKDQRQIDDLLNATTPTDGSEIDTPAIEQFEAEAQTLAQGQYNAMKGFGTNEEGLFVPITELNGAQLCKVYQAYGIKEGKDLFGWYQDELASSTLINVVTYDKIEGCETYADFCSEIDAMRSVWSKSGLPLTF